MSDTPVQETWVSWFRKAAPYIKAHQNKTMVLALSGDAMKSPNLETLIHDVALLNILGVRLVLVFGARPQIDELLAIKGQQASFSHGMRITEPDMMPAVLEAYGRQRAILESKLSMGLVNSPMHGADVRVVSGNFVTAKPVGVLDGIDFACTGVFRKLDTSAVDMHLANRDVVLIPALGYSASGEIFNLAYEELASDIAVELEADKLVFLCDENGLKDEDRRLLRQITIQNAFNLVANENWQVPEDQKKQLKVAADSCRRGVKRTHLISYQLDQALLEELFTRDGTGTMVSSDQYDEIRSARLEDVNGIIELIRPLEQQGILVRRSRERIEQELDCFVVNVRDNAIIACAAIYPYPESHSAELSCFAVDKIYRKEGRGDLLLQDVIEKARSQGLKHLFVLTTQTEHWFKERGFVMADAAQLPGEKLYNTNRNAKVMQLDL